MVDLIGGDEMNAVAEGVLILILIIPIISQISFPRECIT